MKNQTLRGSCTAPCLFRHRLPRPRTDSRARLCTQPSSRHVPACPVDSKPVDRNARGPALGKRRRLKGRSRSYHSRSVGVSITERLVSSLRARVTKTQYLARAVIIGARAHPTVRHGSLTTHSGAASREYRLARVQRFRAPLCAHSVCWCSRALRTRTAKHGNHILTIFKMTKHEISHVSLCYYEYVAPKNMVAGYQV